MGGRGRERAGREGLCLEGRVLQLLWGMGGGPSKHQLGPDPHLGAPNLQWYNYFEGDDESVSAFRAAPPWKLSDCCRKSAANLLEIVGICHEFKDSKRAECVGFYRVLSHSRWNLLEVVGNASCAEF